MKHLLSLLPVLVIVAALLMAGMLMSKEPGESNREAFIAGLGWSGSLLFFFSTEFWLLGVSSI